MTIAVIQLVFVSGITTLLLFCNPRVHIMDKSGDDVNAPITFDLELSFDDFRKFVLKYADKLEEKLTNS